MSIVALGHLIREYNRLREPLQFPDGIVREIVLTTHDPVTDPCSTTLQFNNSDNGTNDDANPV